MIVQYIENENSEFREFENLKQYESWLQRKKSKVIIIDVQSSISHLSDKKAYEDFSKGYKEIKTDFIEIDVYSNLVSYERAKKTAILASILEYLDYAVEPATDNGYRCRYVKDFMKLCLTDGFYQIYYLVDFIYNPASLQNLNKLSLRKYINDYVLNHKI